MYRDVYYLTGHLLHALLHYNDLYILYLWLFLHDMYVHIVRTIYIVHTKFNIVYLKGTEAKNLRLVVLCLR